MDNTTIVTGILGLLGTFIIGPLISYRIAEVRFNKAHKLNVIKNRYEKIYCPLVKLLMNTHISTGRLVYPLSYRLESSFIYLKKFKFKKALHALRINSHISYDISFGTLPIEEIITIIMKNLKWADKKLVYLVKNADLSVYEARGDDFTHDEYKLVNHIYTVYEELNQKILLQ